MKKERNENGNVEGGEMVNEKIENQWKSIVGLF